MTEMLPLNAAQMRMQKNCQGCFYFSGWNCDYILMEGKRRPSRPGDDCTVRKKRGVSRGERLALIRSSNQLPPKPASSTTKKPYTAQVKHPRPVIHATPTTKTVFNQTRKPKRKPRDTIVSKLDTPEVIRMYEAGASDLKIGQAMGCCANSVRKWRLQTGRPANGRKKGSTENDQG